MVAAGKGFVALLLTALFVFPALADVEILPPSNSGYLTVVIDKTASTLEEARGIVEKHEREIEAQAKPIYKAPLVMHAQEFGVSKNAGYSDHSQFNVTISMTYQFSDANVAAAVADVLSLEQLYTISLSNAPADGC